MAHSHLQWYRLLAADRTKTRPALPIVCARASFETAGRPLVRTGIWSLELATASLARR